MNVFNSFTSVSRVVVAPPDPFVFTMPDITTSTPLAKGANGAAPAEISSQIILVPVPGYVYPGTDSASNNNFTVNGNAYSCGSSTTLGPTYSAYKAFTTTSKGWWGTLRNLYNISNGTYLGSSSLGGNSGEYIYFQFPYKILPYGYAISGDTTDRAPSSFKFLASHDSGLTWTTLFTHNNTLASNTADSSGKVYYVLFGKNLNSVSYNRVALVISKIGGVPWNGTTYSDMTGLYRFFILGQIETIAANLFFNFENVSTNYGSDGSSASLSGTSLTYDSTQKKTGIYSLKVVKGSAAGQYFRYPSSGSNYTLDISLNGCTVAFWFRLNATTLSSNLDRPCFFSYGTANPRFISGFAPPASGTDLNTGEIFFICGSSQINFSVSTLKSTPYNLDTTGGWNHIGWSVNTSGGWIASVNGQSIDVSAASTNDLSSMNSLTPFYIGTETTTFGTKWDGNIDDFRLYKQALTLKQLQNLYTYNRVTA